MGNCYGGPAQLEDGSPDYSDPENWGAIHGIKTCSTDWTPDEEEFPVAGDDAKCDCFFVHPTYISKSKDGWNAQIGEEDMLLGKLGLLNILEYIIRAQACTFNGSCRMYCPRYRMCSEAAYEDMMTGADEETGTIDESKVDPAKLARAQAAWDKAYGDVRAAFQYYLDNFSQGRPFIIAGHSQGSGHTSRLLKEVVDKDPALRKRLVAGYCPGCMLGTDTYQYLPLASKLGHAGAVASWSTNVGEGRKMCVRSTFIGREITKQPISINPVTMTMKDSTPEQHLGCLVGLGVPMGAPEWRPDLKFGLKVWNVEKGTDTGFGKGFFQEGGMLYVCGINADEPPDWLEDYIEEKEDGQLDLHIGDYGMYWANIRQNIALQVENYFKQ